MSDSNPYPRIEDYGLIGDCRTAALVSAAGSIDWLCLPRFDSGSVFARLLDVEQGGFCSLTPIDMRGSESSRTYERDTLVLHTTFDVATGTARLIDFLPIPPDAERETVARRVIRIVEGQRGTVEFGLRIAPRFDYGDVRPWIRRHGDRMHSAIGGNDGLIIWCESSLEQEGNHDLKGRFKVRAGERVRLVIEYSRPERIPDDPVDPDPDELDTALHNTIGWWQDWCARIRVRSESLDVRRSALALKALTFEPTGAIVAAPTTSLPEAIPGERNWDYRYSWVRDASFSSRAFVEVGCAEEADAFRRFMMRAAAGHAEDLQIVYGVGGERRVGQSASTSLRGYRDAAPVNIGNTAAGQRQLDAYGELVNLTWRWHRRGHSPDDDHWRYLVSLIDRAAEQSSGPDCGIWEWPGEPDHFVHSKVMCWAALDRGIQLAEECMRRAPTRRWTKVRDQLRRTIERRGYDRRRGVFVQAYDRPDLDCALLLLPTVEFVDWEDERMVRTVDAIREELDAGNGLLYRYRRRDGLKGDEGAFLCCSFWMVECLARAGRLPDAQELFDQAEAAANDLGLFSEELDPATGELRGNFPQGLTHLGHISAAVALSEAQASFAV
ncbi:MAG TPA: glycoside hydrolase family 15 protein [Solirubrobacteraceae bacterium]|nr:glycoside hydrolase family 15 protein [Solirubrobacteraceae bacterium]